MRHKARKVDALFERHGPFKNLGVLKQFILDNEKVTIKLLKNYFNENKAKSVRMILSFLS